jgi:hypothetical protein
VEQYKIFVEDFHPTWDVRLHGSCKNRHFGGTYHLHHQGDKNRQARNNVSGNWHPKHIVKEYCVKGEALVCDTRMRMEGGVGLVGSGVGFGGNVKWPDYKSRLHSFRGGGRVLTVNRTRVKDSGSCHQVSQKVLGRQ